MIKAMMRFHFWGNYSAKIILISENLEEIENLKKQLDFQASCPVFDACGNKYAGKGWGNIQTVTEGHGTVHGFQGWFAKEDLKKAVAQIKAIPGGEQIDSMAKSIDRGPLCTLQV